jgi:hypothetical protein
MTGRAEVARLRQRLDATFHRIRAVGPDPELQADFARYLVILVAGFLETAVAELILEHCRRTAAPNVQRFVESRTRRFTNANTQRIKDLLGEFDPDWRVDLEMYVVDERHAAVNSIVALRNAIAHGGVVGVTFQRVREYYLHVAEVVDHIAELCAPT